MAIVDAQIHLWTGPGAPPHHHRAPFPAEDAIAAMGAAGVDRAVNCPAIWDPASVGYAAETVRAHPDRFVTMPWFRLGGADEADLEQALAAPGVVGLRFVLATPQESAALRAGRLEWLWAGAVERDLPVAVMVAPGDLPVLDDVVTRRPRLRVAVDHLAVLPFDRLPTAAAHLGHLVALARHPNLAVKATGVPSMATDDWPFPSTHDVVRRVYDAFGAERTFWGTDITRMHCSWADCLAVFRDRLPWLRGRAQELVLGDAVAAWLNLP